MSSLVVKKQLIGETCLICEQRKYQGIHLYKTFICIECEKNMITTDTSDPKYQFYLQQLKKATSS
ncbi:sigma factor G inhibitor Gin [Cytobacillus sp. Hm23]